WRGHKLFWPGAQAGSKRWNNRAAAEWLRPRPERGVNWRAGGRRPFSLLGVRPSRVAPLRLASRLSSPKLPTLLARGLRLQRRHVDGNHRGWRLGDANHGPRRLD